MLRMRRLESIRKTRKRCAEGAEIVPLGVELLADSLTVGLENRLQLCLRGGGKKGPLDTAAGEALRVALHHLRRIPGRVEAQAHEPQPSGDLRVLAQTALHPIEHRGGQGQPFTSLQLR